MSEWVNQSMSEWVDQSINQWERVNEWVNQSINQWTNQILEDILWSDRTLGQSYEWFPDYQDNNPKSGYPIGDS